MQVVWVGVGWNTLSLYAAPIIDEWGISRAGFMLTITLVATCNTVISLFFYGLLVQKLGVRKLVWVGGLLCTSGLAVFALSQGVWMLYATGILFGTGCALLNNNAVNTVVQAWFRRRTGTFISVASTFGSVAGIVAAIAVAALINSAGWRPALGATAILSVVGMMVCGVLYKGDPESLGVAPMYSETGQEGDSPGLESRPEGGPSYSSMIRSPRFWALGAVELAIGIVGYAVLANLALMVSDFGFGAYSGAALSVALAGSAVFLIPSGLILDKFGSAWLVALCFGFVVAAMLISFAGASSLPMVYVVAVLLGAGYDMCLTAPGITTLEAFGSREYARKMGTLCGFLYAGCAMGPTVMGLFADLGGGSYNTAFLVFTALGVISAVAIFPLTKVRRGRVGMGAPREASKDSFTA
jgi:MFS family permease